MAEATACLAVGRHETAMAVIFNYGHSAGLPPSVDCAPLVRHVTVTPSAATTQDKL
jgi:hypothetical protein